VVAEIIQTSSEWIKQAILLTATAQDNKKIHQGHLSFLILSLKQNNSFFLSKRNIYFIDSKLNSTILYSLYRITSASNAILERPTRLPVIDLIVALCNGHEGKSSIYTPGLHSGMARGMDTVTLVASTCLSTMP